MVETRDWRCLALCRLALDLAVARDLAAGPYRRRLAFSVARVRIFCLGHKARNVRRGDRDHAAGLCRTNRDSCASRTFLLPLRVLPERVARQVSLSGMRPAVRVARDSGVSPRSAM